MRGLKHCSLHLENLCYAASSISDQPFALGIPQLTLADKLLTASLAKWLSVRLRTKWLRVRVSLQSLITFGIQNNIT